MLSELKGSIQKIIFYAPKKNEKDPEEYVKEHLETGGYKGCTIKEVYLNDTLVFEDITV